MSFRAVIFDLGGVVLGSPLQAIAAYERQQGLPTGFVGRVVLETGPGGAWSRLERGEIGLETFFADFEAECGASGEPISAREMMLRMSEAAQPRPAMLEAIRRLRKHGLLAAALTNNFGNEGDPSRALRPHFDAFLESSVLGLRKPDPRIYETACERLAIEPAAAVFLDDIGANLKTARAMGMTTIKVEEPETALVALGQLVGLALLGAA